LSDTEEEIGFQFYDDLGEGLTELLDEYFGGEAFAAASRIISWLKNGASDDVHAELAVVMQGRGLIKLSPHTVSVGWLEQPFAQRTCEALEDAGETRQPVDN
jgi:hypothetical protein